MQVLWNGGFTDEFLPTRGVRQGDPISPYFFVLTMERLGQVIRRSVSNGNWVPVVLSRGGPPFSYLFVADDLMLFGEASVDNAVVMKAILDELCSCSGYKVNASKCQIRFSDNTDAVLRKEIGNALCVLRSKYKVVEVCPNSITRLICSFVWRSLSKIWHLYCDKVC